MTSRYENKTCPFFQDLCKQEQCALFDPRLDNCGINLVIYNLFKLDRSMTQSLEGTGPRAPQNQPAQPRYPGMR